MASSSSKHTRQSKRETIRKLRVELDALEEQLGLAEDRLEREENEITVIGDFMKFLDTMWETDEKQNAKIAVAEEKMTEIIAASKRIVEKYEREIKELNKKIKAAEQ